MRNQSTFLGMTQLEAIVLVIVAGILAVVITALLMSGINRYGTLGELPPCSNHIRQIIQAMVIYANSNNDIFPCVPPPNNYFINGADPAAAPSVAAPHRPAAAGAYYKTNTWRYSMRGSPLACMWLLVLTEQLSPKCFICPQDPTAIAPSELIASTSFDKPTRYYLNFGMGDNGPMPCGRGESYSISYPWAGHSRGKWWSSDSGTEVPLVCDMAPMQDPHAPGHKARDVTQPLANTYGNYIFNSGNHNGDGQNVGYADDHVVWCTNPYVGVNNDNIFTYGSTGTGGGGTAIAPYLIAPTPHLTDKYPYDTVMVPTRNVQTGRW